MTRNELLERIDCSELTDWMAYFIMEREDQEWAQEKVRVGGL